jgi:hypothetical protein
MKEGDFGGGGGRRRGVREEEWRESIGSSNGS